MIAGTLRLVPLALEMDEREEPGKRVGARPLTSAV